MHGFQGLREVSVNAKCFYDARICLLVMDVIELRQGRYAHEA